MMLRDLQLPQWNSDVGRWEDAPGLVLEFGTDRIKTRDELCGRVPLQWSGPDGLAGDGRYNNYAQSRQPFIGCPTGGDIVADMLMRQLAKQSLGKREAHDDDPRWRFVG